MLNYPEPRYPNFKKPKSIEDILPIARYLVNQPPGQRKISMRPSYNITAESKVLFVVLSEYDPMIVEAMCKAMRENKAHVDLLTLDSTHFVPAPEIGAEEAMAFGKEDGDYSYYYTMICNLLRSTTAQAMVDLEKYTMIISGLAGYTPPSTVPWFYFNFPYLEDFASPLINFPLDVLQLIDDKLIAQVRSAEFFRLTDPEGTDITWTNYDDGRYHTPQHVRVRPQNPGYGYGGTKDGGKDDCNGVVAGTLNHLGAFPHCKAYIEGGLVARLEGGGKYGDIWREKLENYNNIKLGRTALVYGEDATYEIKDPGMFWFMECAVGTHPKSFRLPKAARFECYASNLHDRKRTGYIHCGFGPSTRGRLQNIEAGLPWVHLHIHLLFATLEGRTNKGEKIVLIDKGHLTALDDQEVRSLASKYGDPDELLREIWIPGMPGINMPGDYMKDYAQDPVSWIIKEAIEHPVFL